MANLNAAATDLARTSEAIEVFNLHVSKTEPVQVGETVQAVEGNLNAVAADATKTSDVTAEGLNPLLATTADATQSSDVNREGLNPLLAVTGDTTTTSEHVAAPFPGPVRPTETTFVSESMIGVTFKGYEFLRGSDLTPTQDSPRAQLATPLVSTLGVNAIGPTSANVVGAVNPNGVVSSWWVTYGTTLPLPGANTASTAIGSGTTPITVTFQLTGLTTGLTYYVAVVGQSTAGTVFGQTLSFVPTAPISPSGQPFVPFGQPAVTLPHFNVPFVLVTSGTQSGAVVVEQDTLEEVLANVTTVCLCVEGQCAPLSTFGRPDLTFAQEPVASEELVEAIQQWEPRASEDVISQLAPDGQTWRLLLTTSATGNQIA